MIELKALQFQMSFSKVLIISNFFKASVTIQTSIRYLISLCKRIYRIS